MNPYVPPTVLGVATGLRSMLPLAVLALSSPAMTRDPILQVVSRSPVAALLVAGAGAELVADKLPGMPSRLSSGGLTGRLVLGALVGALAARIEGASLPLSAACGLVGAGAGAWTGYNVRHELGVMTDLPDPVLAVLEDVITLTLALWSARAALDQPLSAPIVKPRMK